MKVTILNFSGRKNGNCSAVSRYIARKHEHLSLFLFDIHSHFTTCGSCDYECLKPELTCPNLTELQRKIMDTICRSDLVYYIIPNYCGMPCANYYAFNERSVGYFNLNRSKMETYMSVRKRFVIISNAENEQFVYAMQQQTDELPDILYLKTRKYGKQSIAGNILESDAAKADLDAWLSY